MKYKTNRWLNIICGLIAKGLTIATMESCTGGGIANEITNIVGASEVLKESYITYSTEAKIKFGVPKNVIEKYGVYSAETAIEMAKAAKRQAHSDVAIGITGELGKIDHNSPYGTTNCVWYAIINQNDEVVVKKKVFQELKRENQKKTIINIISGDLLDVIEK